MASVSHEAGRTCIVKSGARLESAGAHMKSTGHESTSARQSHACLWKRTPLSELILKLNSTRNAIMEPRVCEGLEHRAQRERAGEKRRRAVLLPIPPNACNVSARETSPMTEPSSCHFLLGRSQWGGLTGIHGPEAYRHLILTFLPLFSSTGPVDLPSSSRWKSGGKYLASDTISSLQ